MPSCLGEDVGRDYVMSCRGFVPLTRRQRNILVYLSVSFVAVAVSSLFVVLHEPFCVSTRTTLVSHRSTRGSSKIAEGKVDPHGVAVGNEPPGQLRKPSLVIEDYYCVTIESSSTKVAPESLVTDTVDASPKAGATGVPPPGPDSSFLSDGEGPAQWLAAPKVGLPHGDDLSMESADDTSESEGK